jgi:HAD superfamily hydrolase (TIGR01549 family)
LTFYNQELFKDLYSLIFMARKVKLISFDFDGTLCPVTGTLAVFEEEFVKLLKEKTSLNLITSDVRKELKEKLSEKEWKEMKSAAMKNYLDRAVVPKNISSVLINLKKEYRLVIFSAGKKKYIEGILKKSGLGKETFDKIYSASEDFKIRFMKYPWMYKKIANDFGLEPHECIHIGDCVVRDYHNAKKAGFKAFIVNHDSIDYAPFDGLDKI